MRSSETVSNITLLTFCRSTKLVFVLRQPTSEWPMPCPFSCSFVQCTSLCCRCVFLHWLHHSLFSRVHAGRRKTGSRAQWGQSWIHRLAIRLCWAEPHLPPPTEERTTSRVPKCRPLPARVLRQHCRGDLPLPLPAPVACLLCGVGLPLLPPAPVACRHWVVYKVDLHPPLPAPAVYLCRVEPLPLGPVTERSRAEARSTDAVVTPTFDRNASPDTRTQKMVGSQQFFVDAVAGTLWLHVQSHSHQAKQRCIKLRETGLIWV